MRVQFDIQKSLATERLQAVSTDFNQKINIVLFFFLAFMLIIAGILLPTLLLVQSIKLGTLTISGILVFFLFYAIGALTIYGLIRDSRLRKFTGKNSELNKKVLKAILKERYNTSLVHEGEKMISYYRRPSFWNFGIRVIILFEDKNAFINISRFNQIDLKSFLHAVSSDLSASSIIKEFEKKIERLL